MKEENTRKLHLKLLYMLLNDLDMYLIHKYLISRVENRNINSINITAIVFITLESEKGYTHPIIVLSGILYIYDKVFREYII